jgi:cytochrome c oxidase cbb3-type subunit I
MVTSPPDRSSESRIFVAFTVSATVWLLIMTAAGLLASFEFSYPDLGSQAWMSFGRLRAMHTNGTFFGWATMALIGSAMWAVARSSGVRLQNQRFAWAAMWLFNIATVLGSISLDTGLSNGSQEYREWIMPVYLLLVVAVLCSAVVVFSTIAKRVDREIYIGNWYIAGGFIFISIIAVTGILPFYQKGLGQVAVQGFYIHNAVGMWFTFLGLGVTYYTLPKLLNRPIYSYSLGVLGFWTQLLFYPMIGAHHFLFSPLPWWIQTLAVIFSIGMIVPVWAAVGNFWMTMNGQWSTIRRSYALPFILVGVVSYFFGSTQGSIEAIRELQAVWHFTNFTVGHSHLTMYGFVTFVAWGGIYGLLPAATKRQPNIMLTGFHFWFATLGVGLYVLSLSVAGTLQGLTWATGSPFVASLAAAQPYWLSRAVGGMLMFASHLIFAYNVYLMAFAPQRSTQGRPAATLGVTGAPV